MAIDSQRMTHMKLCRVRFKERQRRRIIIGSTPLNSYAIFLFSSRYCYSCDCCYYVYASISIRIHYVCICISIQIQIDIDLLLLYPGSTSDVLRYLILIKCVFQLCSFLVLLGLSASDIYAHLCCHITNLFSWTARRLNLTNFISTSFWHCSSIP